MAEGMDSSIDIITALKQVFKNAMAVDGIVRGLHQVAKSLDRREAQLCVLAESCDEPTYIKLVEALCAEHSVNLVKIESGKTLGELAGQCKIDRQGNARKVVPCSCVVVKDIGENSPGWEFILEHIKSTM